MTGAIGARHPFTAKIYKPKSLLATDKRIIESRKFDYPLPCHINEDLNIIIKQIQSKNQLPFRAKHY